MQIAEALKEWRDFYLLVGTAGATLLALLFVAVSIGVGFVTEQRKAATRTFMSPVVIHFTSVFFGAAVAMAPSHRGLFYAVPLGATAVIGAVVSSVITVQVLRTDMTRYWQDHLAYGLLPVVGYVALAVAAALFARETASAPDELAGSLLLLTIVNIRNVWDLMLTMVRQHQEPN
ncbi:MAG: hypothetical protein P8Y53_24780 [Pseudolabrys sp.]|jgi:hypothetical protein